MIEILVEQGSDEWHELRRNKIGASMAPIIMEMSPWKTPYKLWREILGLDPKQETNDAMIRGNQLEPIARSEFENMTGIKVFPKVFMHDRYPWMMASLDGIDDSKQHVVEIKCPGRTDHEMALDGIIPGKYIPQLQHQMEVCGVNSMFYFSFNGSSGKILELNRDDAYIESLLHKEFLFWKCVQDLEEPDLSDKDYIIREDDEWSQFSSNWISVQSKIKELVKEEEELRKSLISLAGNCNVKGAGVKLSRLIRKGNVDYKAIPEIQDIDIDKYRKSPIETWRLGVI